MSFAMLTIIGREYVERKTISLTQLNYSLEIHAQQAIFALTVLMDYNNVEKMENACQLATMVIVHRVLTVNHTSIAIWGNALILKRLMINVFIEMNVEDRRLVSLTTLGQFPEYVRNT